MANTAMPPLGTPWPVEDIRACYEHGMTHEESVNAVADLLARVEALHAALKPFADFAEVWLRITPPHQEGFYAVQTGHETDDRSLTREHMQAALAAMKEAS